MKARRAPARVDAPGLAILLQKGEGTTLEYKEDVSSSLAREFVAFANTVGGRVLLGVRDSIGGIAELIPQLTEEVTEAVTAEVTDDVCRLLEVVTGAMLRRELQEALGLKHEVHFGNKYLVPVLEAGSIEMTNPDKPRSSNQRYRKTPR